MFDIHWRHQNVLQQNINDAYDLYIESNDKNQLVCIDFILWPSDFRIHMLYFN